MVDFTQRRIVMVDTQVRPSDVTRFPVIEAMLSVPREVFLPPALREAAYAGEHVPLAPGRVMLDPRTTAKLIDTLDIQPGERVLVIGAGLGYTAALLARMAGAAVALEELPDLARAAPAALAQAGVTGVTPVQGPLADGAPREAPFDVILIEGGAEIVPGAILSQLAEGGRIAALIMSGALGEARIGHKRGTTTDWRLAFAAGAPVLPGFARARAFTF